MCGMWEISIALLLQHSIFTGIKFVQATSPVVIAFERAGIVPDAISVAPQYELSVVYRSGAQVQLGNEIPPDQVQEIPYVSLNPFAVRNRAYYTLIFFDPDVPSRQYPLFRSLRHWLVVNIAGQQISSGQTITQYLCPTPPPGTGPHRYAFLYYRQPSSLFFNELSLLNGTISKRDSFSIRDFAAKYKLELIAGNFFFSQFS